MPAFSTARTARRTPGGGSGDCRHPWRNWPSVVSCEGTYTPSVSWKDRGCGTFEFLLRYSWSSWWRHLASLQLTRTSLVWNRTPTILFESSKTSADIVTKLWLPFLSMISHILSKGIFGIRNNTSVVRDIRMMPCSADLEKIRVRRIVKNQF